MAHNPLTRGSTVADFSIADKDCNVVGLSSLLGKKVIRYFYPAASTPGCTTQACDFSDSMASLQGSGSEVLGVSEEKRAALQKFATEENLGSPLPSDPDLEVRNAYETCGETSMHGKTAMGVIRSTFVIDEDDIIFPRPL